MLEIQPPNQIKFIPTLFLGGAISDGHAENWQENIINDFNKYDIIIANPRRDNWTNLSEEEMMNQIEWEYNAQKMSQHLFYYFHPEYQCPITLLELGLFATKNPIICCPPKFWRHQNVKYICQKYRLDLFLTLEASINYLKVIFKEWINE